MTNKQRNQFQPNAGPGAVVTDASERLALHVVRALGRAGVSVSAVDLECRSSAPISCSSRYASQCHLLADWDETEAGWLDELLRCGSEGDVLLPSCLNAFLRVLANRDLLSRRFRLLLPSMESLRTANDKWRLYKICTEQGISCPATYCPSSHDDLQRLSEKLTYPVILKFRNDENLYVGAEARYAKVRSASDLLDKWQRFDEMQGNPLIQEFISGDGWGFEALYDAEGRMAARFCHHRLMEYPIAGGPSVVCESVKVPELEQIGRKVLERLSWRGVAMVEFKRCAKTGKFYLLEINPRFWGSLPLSEAAGVNFPYLLYRAALGEPVEVPDYRVGVRMRLLPTYLLSLAAHIKASPWAVGQWLPKLRYLLDPRVCEGLFAADDLKPALAYLRTRMGRA